MKRTVLILGASFSIMMVGFVSLAFAAENVQDIQDVQCKFGLNSCLITPPSNLICIDSIGQAKYCAGYSPFSQNPITSRLSKITIVLK